MIGGACRIIRHTDFYKIRIVLITPANHLLSASHNEHSGINAKASKNVEPQNNEVFFLENHS
jgi:hypothetical protein